MITITRKFTREQLIAKLQHRIAVTANYPDVEEAQLDATIFKIALASLDAGSDSNDHPANSPLSNDRLHRISDILSKAAAQRDGGSLGYAMSDAVKAIDELLEGRKAEPVAWRYRTTDINGNPRPGWSFSEEASLMGLYQPLYAAPPAPAIKEHQIRELVNELRDIAVEYHGTQQLRERIARTIRAAMLNGGKS